MKKTKWIMPLLALSIALASCTGDDGEPGPQGDPGAAGPVGDGIQKLGYFSGTVIGKRTDGTAFSETFKYEYGPSNQGFEDFGGIKTIDFYRYNQSSYSSSQLETSNLELSGNTLVANPSATSIYFSFIKEINSTDLFKLSARPYFRDVASYVLELSEAQNATYNFERTSDGTVNYYSTGYTDPTNNQYTSVYVTYASLLNGYYQIYYRQDNGTLSSMYDTSIGQYITSGTVFDTYNKLTFKNDVAKNILAFFDKATNTSLAVVIPTVTADTFTVTNYTQDASTGFISFDYILKISKFRPRTGYSFGSNSTSNDLTITGSFNSGGKVYKNVVGRTASGG